MKLQIATRIVDTDPNAEAWDAVQWARDARAMAEDLGIPYSVTDRDGRPIVDALPSFSEWVLAISA